MLQPDARNCAICNREALAIHPLDRIDGMIIQCERCGEYEITRQGYSNLADPNVQGENRYLISGVARNHSERGKRLLVRTDNLDAIIAAANPPQDPIEAIQRFLLLIHERTDAANEYVKIDRYDYPLIYARSFEEFRFLGKKLQELNWAEYKPQPGYRLTLEGWRKIDELHSHNKRSRQAFVAMWFSDELLPAYENGIQAALIETGYEPVRIDQVQHNHKIDDQIIAEIRRSGLLVADFTGQRGGVYFEAGFAMGLGIPVIWTCREDDVNDLHFDTRQYNHIVWETPEILKSKLVARIEATVPRL